MKLLVPIIAMLAATPALAVTATSGAVGAQASISVGAGTDANTQQANAVGLPTALAAAATATLPEGTASSSVRASWASATQGSVTMSYGWVGDSSQAGSTSLNTASPLNEGWSYNFTTGNAPGSFNASWTLAITGSESSFGLQGVYGSGSSPFNVTPFNVAPVSDSGNFSVALLANTAYNFTIFNFGNRSGGGSVFDSSALFNMDWNIDGGVGGVPEPSSWAMLIAGFGLVGAGMRQRRRIAA